MPPSGSICIVAIALKIEAYLMVLPRRRSGARRAAAERQPATVKFAGCRFVASYNFQLNW